MSAASVTVPSAPSVSIATIAGGRAVGPGSGGPGGSAGPTAGGKCCENGRIVTADPLTGQTICSCQYNPALLMAAGCYPRGVGVPGMGDGGVYASPYSAMQGLLPGAPGVDPATFYSSMGALQGAGYYAYDPFGGYPYGNGFSMDPNARRKNATRESTQTLKAWLSEHRKNPYPTKGEKIMLAIITKMTLTQVSTWFANARRRLKKENKMTWSPRNRCGEDDDDDVDVDDDDKVSGEARGDDNDTNNNRDFADDDPLSDHDDIDVLDCDSDIRPGLGMTSSSLLSEQCRRSINMDRLAAEDLRRSSLSPNDNEEKHNKINTSLGSAFTMVSPSSRGPINSKPDDRHSLLSRLPADPHVAASERMRNGQPSSLTSSVSPPAATILPQRKPKIWSVADVVSSSSSTSGDRDARTPPSPLPSQVINGHHMPHPAFPTPTGHPGGPSLGLPRGMGLWTAPCVTSLAAVGARYHPYGTAAQGLFSVAQGRGPGAAFHGLPSGMMPGLIGAHHHPSLSLPGMMVGGPAPQPTDLRKTSPIGHPVFGRASRESPDVERRSGSLRASPKDDGSSHGDSPPPTAFRPVHRR